LRSPALPQVREHLLELVRLLPHVVLVRSRVEEREPADSPGIGRCIERGERAAVMGTEQEGAFGTGGVEDGVEVLHPRFERGVMPPRSERPVPRLSNRISLKLCASRS